MEIQTVTQGRPLQEGGTTPSTETVDQDEFLQLLIVQLQNQDPLNPLESQQFLEQLATFNSLEQLIGINGKLDSMRSEQLRLGEVQATSLIGKEVSAEGNSLSLSAEGGAEAHYTLGADATRVVVNITDSRGNLVRALEVGGQNAGDQTVVWDGKDTSGNRQPPGVYGFEVNAFDLAGKRLDAKSSIQGIVTGVDLAGDAPVLEIGALKVPLSAITTVGQNA